MKLFCYGTLYKQSGRRDSNPLPTAWEAVALPGELLPLSFINYTTGCKVKSSFNNPEVFLRRVPILKIVAFISNMI
jgi:hypothetical protein